MGAAGVLLASILALQPAAAVPITFFGEDTAAGGALPIPNSAAAQASFLSQLIGVSVESFEGIAVGTQFPMNLTFGPDTATLTGTNTVSSTGVQNSGLLGRFATSGSNYLNVGSSDAASFTLTFSSPQAAFGFFATDIGDVSGQLAIELGGVPVVVPHTVNAPNGSALFFGVIDVASPFTTVRFTNTTGTLGDAFGFDQMTIGRRDNVANPPTAVPDGGASITMLAIGLLGLAARRLWP